jgi:hypothetical protein
MHPTRLLTAAFALSAGLSATAGAQPMPTQLPADGWTFTVTPYFWASGINGTVTTPFQRLPQRDVSADFDELFSDISGFVFMGSAEARKGRIMLVGDVYTVSLSAGFSTPNDVLFRGGDGELDLSFAQVTAMYRVVDEPWGLIDLGVGARAWWAGATLKLNSGLLPGQSASENASWVDPIAVARAQWRISEQFSLSAYGDVGGGGVGSTFTWQAIGTLDWMPAPWVALRAGWRYLAIDYSKPTFAIDIGLSGPILGATFRF